MQTKKRTTLYANKKCSRSSNLEHQILLSSTDKRGAELRKLSNEQLKGVCQIIKDWSLVEVRLISNEWHLPRIQAMVECSPALAMLRQIRWTLVSAEEVLLSSDLLKWGPIVEKMRSNPRTAQRIALEKKGDRKFEKALIGLLERCVLNQLSSRDLYRTI